MSMDTDGEAAENGAKDGSQDLGNEAKKAGERRRGLILARPNEPINRAEPIKEEARRIAATAAKLSPVDYMESARGLYRKLLDCSQSALLFVNLAIIEAYHLRDDPKKSAEKVEAMLADIDPRCFDELELYRAIYEDENGDRVISHLIDKAAKFLAGLIAEPKWEKIPQGRIINDIERPNEYLPLVVIDPISGAAEVQHNNLILKATSAGVLESLGSPTFQFLDFLLLKAHRLGNFSGFKVSVSEFMKARGVKDRKGVKAQIKNALRDLYEVSMRYDKTKLTKKEQKSLPKHFPLSVDFRILDAKAEINSRGDIAISFGRAFAPYLASVAPMEYHRSLLRLNTHTYPYAHALGRKLLEVFNMGIERNRAEIERGLYEVRLAVPTLLKVTGLPTEEKVAKLDRNYLARIIRPFEKNLGGLADMGAWEYCKPKGEPLGAKDDPTQFSVFKSLLVRFTFKDYPAQERRIERHEKKIEEAKRRREKAAKKEEPKS